MNKLMKKAFTLLVMIVSPTMAFAQGRVVFQNQTGLVAQWTSIYDSTPISVPVGGGHVQLIAAPQGTALPNALLFPPGTGMIKYSSLLAFLADNPGWAAAATTAITGLAGRFNGGTVTISNIIEGANADYFVIGWMGSYSNYDSAAAALVSDPTASFLGVSAIATTATGDPLTIPPEAPVNLRTTFAGMTVAPITGLVSRPDFSCATNDGTVTITRYNGSGGAVVIPDTINGFSVTGIGSGAFSGTKLTSVTIPGSVTNIGSGAFRDCSNLVAITVDALDAAYTSTDGVLFNKSQTTLLQCPGGKAGRYTISNSVTSIGDEAFFACSLLSNMVVPSSVTNIGTNAFARCTSLQAITVDALNVAYCSVDGVLFNKAQTTLLEYPASKGEGDYAVPSSVTGIGEWAFADCTSLINITIPESVTGIGGSTFEYCTNLTAVYFQGNAPSGSDPSTFQDDSNVTVYYLPGTTGWGTTFGGRPTALLGFQNSTDFTCLINYGAITITGYRGPGGAVVIPDSIDSLPVTGIGDYVFYNSTSLTDVTIGKNLTTIGMRVFEGCTSLTAITVDPENTHFSSVAGVLLSTGPTALVLYPCAKAGDYIIPDGVISIKYRAFYNCTRLTSVVIPNSVARIEDDAFYYCTGLTSVTIGDGVTSIGDNAFSECVRLARVTLGNSVTSIGWGAFVQCMPLTTITIPDSVTNIGAYAFCQCNSLTNVTIPNGVTSIEDDTFYYCNSLSNITIGNSVTRIGSAAFESCSSMASVTIPNSVTDIADNAFEGCTSLASVTLGNSVNSIGAYAFGYCPRLSVIAVDALNSTYSSSDGVLFNKSQTTLIQCPGGKTGSYNVPSTVTGIANHAFEDCTSLTSVVIRNSVTNLGDYAFHTCTSLASISIPNTITRIGISAFESCFSLTTVTIPDSVTSIGTLAFYGCRSFTNITIPSGVTNIGDRAFECGASLRAITVDPLNSAYSSADGVLFNKGETVLIQCPGGKAGSYTIPDSVTIIEDHALENCSSLSSVTIPNSVSSIGNSLFYACSSLTHVTIGNRVTSIGNSAFSDCFNLMSITIPNSVTSIGDDAFGGCSSLTSVTIGNNVTNIGTYAFLNCGLHSVGIPNSVTSIGIGAFESCLGLTGVTIGNGLTSIGANAFADCSRLIGVWFEGNCPTILFGSSVFYGANKATAYYLPGTIGWGPTFGGRPTALWTQVPILQTPPQTQTAEATSAVGLRVKASGALPLCFLWYLNDTNLISWSTNADLELTNVQIPDSGAYTVVVTNVAGAVTSAPAMLNVIAAVERRPVPGVKVTGETGSLLNVDYADSLSPAPNWTTLGSVSMSTTSQYYFDLTLPLPPQRFYRAWQTGAPGVIPLLDLHMVPAITLTGAIGRSVRLDYINRFGPIDAWVTLETVALTNTSQLYFDTSSVGQPARLWRVAPVP
jgi:hypothetical protein